MRYLWRIFHRNFLCRYLDPNNIISKPECKPIAAYNCRKECKSLEELGIIRYNIDELVMESLTIRWVSFHLASLELIRKFCKRLLISVVHLRSWLLHKFEHFRGVNHTKCNCGKTKTCRFKNCFNSQFLAGFYPENPLLLLVWL